MTNQFDVLVVGGGIVGLVAALAMAKRNHTVALIDAGSLEVDTSKMESRVYAINQVSQKLLADLHVWDLLDQSRVSPYSSMHVWDGVNGAHIDFDSRAIAAARLGSIIEENIIKQALLKCIAHNERISLFANTSITAIQQNPECISISNQDTSWQGQLLMIADGAHSPLRTKLKVELVSWPYNQQAIVATIKTEKPHQKTAWQVFNPDGPLALLPLVNENQCSIVWSTLPGRAKYLLELNDQQFNTELSKAFAHKLGALEVISSRYQYPLHMRHVKRYTGARWLLLGDAAHTIHPLAGLGLNVGLADVQAWMNALDTIAGPLASSKRLGAYQRERKNAVWQTILLMEGFKRLFGYSLGPITALRAFGLRACNKLTALKRMFIEHAAGK